MSEPISYPDCGNAAFISYRRDSPDIGAAQVCMSAQLWWQSPYWRHATCKGRAPLTPNFAEQNLSPQSWANGNGNPSILNRASFAQSLSARTHSHKLELAK